jgi:hypothetical protein
MVWRAEPGKQKPRSCRTQEFGPKQCPGKRPEEKGKLTQLSENLGNAAWLERQVARRNDSSVDSDQQLSESRTQHVLVRSALT